jgi:hypothetical protein
MCGGAQKRLPSSCERGWEKRPLKDVYIAHLALSSSPATENPKSTYSLAKSAKNDDMLESCVAALKKDVPPRVCAE